MEASFFIAPKKNGAAVKSQVSSKKEKK